MAALSGQNRETTAAAGEIPGSGAVASAGGRIRGACPSLAAPMATGDGLLVRLRPTAAALRIEQMLRLTDAAARYGNGIIEVTARGNLQLRGLRQSTLQPLATALAEAAIGIETGVAIETPALAGIDPLERADAGAMADRLRCALADLPHPLRLAAKFSIVVDGAGTLRLDALPADIRLTASSARPSFWQLTIAGTADTAAALGTFADEDAVATVVDLLRQIERLGPKARAKDLLATGAVVAKLISSPADASLTSPIGRHDLKEHGAALGLRLPHGGMPAAALAAFLRQVAVYGADEVRLAHDHVLILTGIDGPVLAATEDAAQRHGLSWRADDPASAIAACAGQGACASGLFQTRAAAALLLAEAPALLAGLSTVHLSGCAKGCAHPAAAAIAVVGAPMGYGLVVNGPASAPPIGYIGERDLEPALRQLGRLVENNRNAGESAGDCLTRLGTDAILAALKQR